MATMKTVLAVLFAAGAFAAAAPAQNATFTTFGAASGSTFYGQRIAANGLPQLGATFSVGVDYTVAPPACLTVITPYAVWLVLGFSNQSWLGLPLPIAMPQGFDLLVSADSVVANLVNSSNSCPPGINTGQGPSFSLSIPNNTGLLGVQFHQQILLARAQSGISLPPLATDGGTATIGF